MAKETECPKMEDGIHCQHWYDGGKCCACGAPAMSEAERFENGMEVGMNFGDALKLCKQGSKIQREGWNGKGMYIVCQAGYPDGIAINQNTADATGLPVGTVCVFNPYLMMRATDGSFFPWNPNQLDLLTEDWEVVD
jgi:hypothetical protein